jgi:hypothetical protein
MPGKKYELFVQKGRPISKIITGILFSHLGLFTLCLSYGALGKFAVFLLLFVPFLTISYFSGAYIFLLLELPNEENRHEEKKNRTVDVDESMDYLKSIFYHYATNEERYNFTRDQYMEAVYADLDTLKKFVVTYHSDYNYDMTEEWDYDWTFPKAFLFTITIMTTVGKYFLKQD